MAAFKSSFVLIALLVSVMAVPMPQTGAKPFTLQNGKDALALNAGFQSLTPNSPCNSGQDACVNGKFAQCANGKFVLTGCAGGTICAALPLVNKPGTSITCTTEADKNARIAATGATAPAGNSNAAAAAPPASPPAVVAAAPSPSAAAASSGAPSGAKPFTLQNGKDAQALNSKFATLTPASSCTSGDIACVNQQFAQCVGGKFVLTQCAAGLQCSALPLVNSPGTSITCVDTPQALARIGATGAGQSLTGQ